MAALLVAAFITAVAFPHRVGVVPVRGKPHGLQGRAGKQTMEALMVSMALIYNWMAVIWPGTW